MVTRWQASKPGEATALKAQCIDLARAILTTWREEHYGLPHLGDVEIRGPAGGPRDARRSRVDRRLPRRSHGEGCDPRAREVARGGLRDARMEDLREGTPGGHGRARPTTRWRGTSACSSKSARPGPGRRRDGASSARRSREALVAAVERADRGPSQDDWRTRRVDRAEVLAGLARSLILTGAGRSPVSRRGARPGRTEDVSAPVRAHAGAGEPSALAREERRRSPSPRLTTWLSSCREQLESLTAKAPEAPKTFRRAAEIKCTCQDCAELKQFLKDPGESSHRFSMRQDRRRPPREQYPPTQVRPGPQDRDAGLSAYLDLHQEHGVVPGEDEGIPPEPGASGDRPGHRSSSSGMIERRR